MDNNAEVDPWAKIGNTAGEVTQEGLAREAAWNNAMADAPEFGGEQNQPTPKTQYENSATTGEAPERDDNIADASAIINYGLNAAAREKGVEETVQAINNFVFKGDEDPVKQLFGDLDIDTGAEMKDVIEESRASKPQENAFRDDVNAPAPAEKSKEGALNAIKEFKELVAEVETSPAYANLLAEALKANKGIFEYAVSKYGTRDLTVLFSALNELKEKPNNTVEQATLEPEEDQSENQSSTENPSPDTDATAKEESLS